MRVIGLAASAAFPSRETLPAPTGAVEAPYNESPDLAPTGWDSGSNDTTALLIATISPASIELSTSAPDFTAATNRRYLPRGSPVPRVRHVTPGAHIASVNPDRGTTPDPRKTGRGAREAPAHGREMPHRKELVSGEMPGACRP